MRGRHWEQSRFSGHECAPDLCMVLEAGSMRLERLPRQRCRNAQGIALDSRIGQRLSRCFAAAVLHCSASSFSSPTEHSSPRHFFHVLSDRLHEQARYSQQTRYFESAADLTQVRAGMGKERQGQAVAASQSPPVQTFRAFEAGPYWWKSGLPGFQNS